MKNPPRWNIPMYDCPEIVQAGIVSYGREPRREHYCLPDLWCIHAYRYQAKLTVGEVRMDIGPRSVSVIPPGSVMTYDMQGVTQHAYAHFRLKPSGEGPNESITAMMNLGAQYDGVTDRMEQMVRSFPMQPRRASVRLWDVLWDLVEFSRQPMEASGGLHPKVGDCVERIELNLDQVLRVGELADQVELSHNQLTRLFKEHLGVTVSEYIQSRKARRARRLLRDTTMPVKQVALEIGMLDLQQFNKFMHRRFGQSPSALRDSRKAANIVQ